jgi:hypothetical protein
MIDEVGRTLGRVRGQGIDEVPELHRLLIDDAFLEIEERTALRFVRMPFCILSMGTIPSP